MSDCARQHHAVIQALASRLADLGHPVSALRLPASLASDGKGEFYVPLRASNIFENVLHVCEPDDPYAIEALNQRQADALAHAKTSKQSEDDLVEMIDEAVIEFFDSQSAGNFFEPDGTYGNGTYVPLSEATMQIDGHYDRIVLARAVLSKLRDAGVIQGSGEEPAPNEPTAVEERTELFKLEDAIQRIEPTSTPLYEALGRKLGR
ncbi:hypothetical protein ACIQW5_10475 [Methylorubrum thiocyanatum]|uniref:hypothetical protein n=1 Tax=Methylorubrum thiocyanatum TaxID=47958 RepID=UPI00383A17C5